MERNSRSTAFAAEPHGNRNTSARRNTTPHTASTLQVVSSLREAAEYAFNALVVLKTAKNLQAYTAPRALDGAQAVAVDEMVEDLGRLAARLEDLVEQVQVCRVTGEGR